jgi:uncharacterized protein (DUF1800 family)
MHLVDQENRKGADVARQRQTPPREAESASAQPLASPRVGTSTVTTPPVEVRVLHKMGFGPRSGDIAHVKQIGVAAYVQEQLHPENIVETSDFNTRFSAQQFQMLDKDVRTLWTRWQGDCPYTDGNQCNDYFDQPYREVVVATWLRAIYSKKQLLEVLVDHWHNHFNVRGEDSYAFYTWPDYERRIRKNVFGNFRTFLEDIATSPAMLYYLDNRTSTSAGPNENYARELFELHTLGVDAYTPGIKAPAPGQTFAGYRDWDVYEAARCLTGWTLDDDGQASTGQFTYRSDWHDRFQKYLLNQFIDPELGDMADGHILLDRVAAHPATARNVSKRLARRLVSDEPSDSLIQAGADAFTANQSKPDQLRFVYQALLTHPDFTNVWGEKFKRPFEMAVSAIRATNADWHWSNDFGWWSWSWFSSMGQGLFAWTPPNGYPDTRRVWLSSTRMTRRWTFLNYLCLDYFGDDQPSTTLVAPYANTPQNLLTPRQLVDYWVQRVLGYPLSSSEIGPLYDFVARGRNLDTALPDFRNDPNNNEHYPERIAGLVALILSLPAAQLR